MASSSLVYTGILVGNDVNTFSPQSFPNDQSIRAKLFGDNISERDSLKTKVIHSFTTLSVSGGNECSAGGFDLLS